MARFRPIAASVMIGERDNPFWDFSLAAYARAGVEGACLALQDRHDLDVNMLLFCCWVGSRGRVLSAEEVARLREVADPWRGGAVRPLRALRRWLKTQEVAPKALSEPLRARIKRLELEAEAVEQSLLANAVSIPDGAGAPALAAANVAAYLAALELAPDDRDMADLVALLCGSFPGLGPAEAGRALVR